MRHRVTLLATILGVSALAACGGGGSAGFNPPPPQPTSTPAGTATQSVGPAGASISVSSQAGSFIVTIPKGALVAPTTVTVTAYSAQGQVPRPVQSKNRRGAQSLPSGFTFLAGVGIDIGSATLYAPVTVTAPTSASVPSGSGIRVATYGSNGLADVDTATQSGSSVKNNVDPKYVSISAGGAYSPYIFYAAPQSTLSTPAPIKLTVAPAPSASPLVIGGSTMFVASGADANGNVLPFTASFSVGPAPNPPASAGSGPNPDAATITASTQGGPAVINVSDSTPNHATQLTGSMSTTVLTERPSSHGDTFAFAGTLDTQNTYWYPQPNPMPSTNVTASVVQNVTVTSTNNPIPGISGSVQQFANIENDTYATQTLSSTTDQYYQTNGNLFQLLGYKVADSADTSTTTVAYKTPQIVDELPEKAGQKWATNSPAATITETNAVQTSGTRTVNADGSYVENDTLYGTGTNYPTVDVTLTENSDGSGNFLMTRHENGNTSLPPGTDLVENYYFTAITQTGNAGLPGVGVGYETYFAGPSYGPTPPPGTANLLAIVGLWFPYDTTTFMPKLYQESNVDNGSRAIPSTCNVPSSAAKSANQVVQSITSADLVLGTLTNTTTTQYVVTGTGPVCVQVASTVDYFYDYNTDTTQGNQGGPFVFQTQPAMQETKIAETLALQKTNANTSASRVGTKSVHITPIAPGAIANARIAVAHQVERLRLQRLRSLSMHILKYAENKGARR